MIPRTDPPATAGRRKKRKFYWSVMLVGEHGRVIPFKYFKEAVIGVCGVLILLTFALLLVSWGYVRQGRLLARQQADATELREQATKLRDEKDMLLAQLVISQKPAVPETPAAQSASPAKADPAKADPPREPEKPPAAAVSKAAAGSAPPLTKMSAKISQFGVDYNSAEAILNIKLRLHNTTPDRQPLAGRIALVLSNPDNTALKPVSIPSATVSDGQSAQSGQAFTVNNYRTMEFKLPNPPAPNAFNTAQVLVFSPEGAEILKQNFTFKIEPPAPRPAEKRELLEGSNRPVAAPPPASVPAAGTQEAAPRQEATSIAPESTAEAPADAAAPDTPPLDELRGK